MARDENDVTEGRTDGEFGERILRDKNGKTVGRLHSSDEVRRRAIDGDAPPSAEEIGKAVASALERQRNAPPEKAAPLAEIVRASVRAGVETIKQGDKVVIRPAKITFKADETADGKEWTVEHGRPIRLKREAFLRYKSEGRVEFG